VHAELTQTSERDYLQLVFGQIRFYR
jgi:hypothetical protein